MVLLKIIATGRLLARIMSGGTYEDYDFVLSGHSHYSHCFMKFYPKENPELRNKKAVTFY